MSKPWTAAVLLSLLGLVAACTSELPLEGRPCPCADGWQCCEDQNVCVPEGDACPEHDTVSATEASSSDSDIGTEETGGTDTLTTVDPPNTDSQTCADTAEHTDCPEGSYCCDFVPMPGQTVCLPEEWWNQTSSATCANKETTSDPGVEHGGQCSNLFGPLGRITGVCQQPDEACAGGFAGAEFIPPLYPGKDPQFNCSEGLLCCIDTDQCEVMNVGLQSIVPTLLKEGSNTQCQPNGGCVDPAYEISDNFACPDGQTCCFTTLME